MKDKACRLYITSWKGSPRIQMPSQGGEAGGLHRWEHSSPQKTNGQGRETGECPRTPPYSLWHSRISWSREQQQSGPTERWQPRAPAVQLSSHPVVQVESICLVFADSLQCPTLLFPQHYFQVVLVSILLIGKWRLRAEQSSLWKLYCFPISSPTVNS